MHKFAFNLNIILDKFLDYTMLTQFDKEIVISGSKSESNRLLVLKQLFSNIKIENIGNAKDVLVLKKAFNGVKIIDIGHAGTAMRFLTAYFSIIEDTVILTGSDRMQNRPIKILVDVLRGLGAEINYLKKEGYPPLEIKGRQLLKESLQINGNVSSQYISALLLIAPRLKNGLTIKLLGNITSRPYIKMTLSLLNRIGVKTTWVDNIIKVYKKEKINTTTITVESDWSSASYFYSLVALSKNGIARLNYFNKNSLQGDIEVCKIYEQFGVKTVFNRQSICLTKQENFNQTKHVNFNLVKTPDIAQTIAVTCVGLGISCDLTGLQTLKIKETDRLQALKNELEKIGAKVRITEDSINIKPAKKLKKNSSICTYDDHRMAMAFAPLSLIIPITIEDKDVVEKSYPNFWSDLEKLTN